MRRNLRSMFGTAEFYLQMFSTPLLAFISTYVDQKKVPLKVKMDAMHFTFSGSLIYTYMGHIFLKGSNS